MLKVGDRINPDCVGEFPRIRSKFLDDVEVVVCKDISVCRLEDKEDVIVFGINILQRLESVELWIILAEKHAITGIKKQVLAAATD